jgi:predicted  nucleic acid-binding Zn-ribbon protein
LSIPDQIRDLEVLAALDARLRTLDEQLSQERGVLNGLTANLRGFEAKQANERSTLAATEKLRNEYIGEVRSMTQQLEHSREKASRSRNEREANAAQREQEELRKLMRDREEEVGRLTTDIDALRKTMEGTEAEIAKISGELGSSAGDISSRLGAVETERSQVAAEREAASKKLPVVLYRRYETIRSKRGTAIAQVTDGTCKACHMALPPQMFHRLRREPLLEQCPSCNRIIYFVPAGPAES